MERAEFFDWTGNKRTSVCTVFLTKVFYFFKGRNAWHTTWVQTYSGNTFYLTLDKAKQAIEPLRAQGSTWTIRELPALALMAEKICLIVCEINTNKPLTEFENEFENNGVSAISLLRLNRRFKTSRANSVMRFVASSNEVLPAKMPFVIHKSSSYSYGRDYRLGWFIRNNKLVLLPIVRILSKTITEVHKKSRW